MNLARLSFASTQATHYGNVYQSQATCETKQQLQPVNLLGERYLDGARHATKCNHRPGEVVRTDSSHVTIVYCQQELG